MKKTKIIYWVTTIILGLMLVPAIFMVNMPATIDSFQQLGVPADWFRYELELAKTLGGLAILVPIFGSAWMRRTWTTLREWAYIGIGIDFVSAFIAIVATFGFGLMAIFPIVALVILVVSYKSYHKLKDNFLSSV